jgi:D-amino peptidase
VRVYISVDMEGVAGVAHEDQTDPTDPRHAAEYNRSCRLMTAEANAAIEGALAAGAARILVNDSHWLMRNLLPEELHPGAELVSGSPKLRSMMEGIELGFDAALCIGYHARAGTAPAVIDHTYTSRVHEARLNGRPVGELALTAALAAEARDLLGETVETVVVKHAVGRFAARSLAPAAAGRRIRSGVLAALGRPHRPFRLASPIQLEVELAETQMADMAELVPGSARTGGRSIAFRHDDYREVFRAWRAIYNLAGTE